LAEVSVVNETIRLRRLMRPLDLDAALETTQTPIAQGDSSSAIERLARLDSALTSRDGLRSQIPTISRARGAIRAISGALSLHANPFDARAPG
jgi:hypothetical protein